MGTKGILAVLAIAGLAACGTNPAERAITGGAIGAGVGAAGAAITGNNVGPGAVVGGLVGAAVGGLTGPETVDLGRPITKR